MSGESTDAAPLQQRRQHHDEKKVVEEEAANSARREEGGREEGRQRQLGSDSFALSTARNSWHGNKKGGLLVLQKLIATEK